jgi:uncharacterized membrane protein YhaH (DUF805 family)
MTKRRGTRITRGIVVVLTAVLVLLPVLSLMYRALDLGDKGRDPWAAPVVCLLAVIGWANILLVLVEGLRRKINGE